MFLPPILVISFLNRNNTTTCLCSVRSVKVDIDDLIGEDGNAEEVERADLKTLAKNINVSEIERVLKVCGRVIPVLPDEFSSICQNDKRYAVFDYIPEQREAWIRVRNYMFYDREIFLYRFQNHLQKLAAPKLSVHVPQQQSS